MSDEEREFYIEWLPLISPYSKVYWENESDENLKLNYKRYWEDRDQ